MAEKVYRNGCEYTCPTHVRFIKEMDAAKLPVELRRTYAGSMPAVRVADRKTALDKCSISLDWEVRGIDVLVYPPHADPLLDRQQKDSWGRDH